MKRYLILHQSQADAPSGVPMAVLTALVVLFALLTLACGSPSHTSHAQQATSVREQPPAPSESSAAAGLRAYRDPSTGELTAPPPGALTQRRADPLAFSSEGLELETLPDGSMKVDLQGRFRSGLYATRGDDGSIQLEHGPRPQDRREVQP